MLEHVTTLRLVLLDGPCTSYCESFKNSEVMDGDIIWLDIWRRDGISSFLQCQE